MYQNPQNQGTNQDGVPIPVPVTTAGKTKVTKVLFFKFIYQ